MTFRLIYTSRAAPNLGDDDLSAILSTSRQWNSEHDITGVLVLVNGYFVQILEGESEAVYALVDKIRRDLRNSDLEVINVRNVAERAFGDWAMGLIRPGKDTPGWAGLRAPEEIALAMRLGAETEDAFLNSCLSLLGGAKPVEAN